MEYEKRGYCSNCEGTFLPMRTIRLRNGTSVQLFECLNCGRHWETIHKGHQMAFGAERFEDESEN
jgi:RNase P subunit RPR2